MLVMRQLMVTFIGFVFFYYGSQWLLSNGGLKPIQRLGETYSMYRIRKPQGRLLPPLPYRPVLMGFTQFLALPMAHVTLSPFPFSLDFQNFKSPSPHRHFFLEHSYVEYYR